MYCYCIEKSEIQKKKKKKGPLIKMVPTLKIFGVVSRFLYSGGWQVCGSWWLGTARQFSHGMRWEGGSALIADRCAK